MTNSKNKRLFTLFAILFVAIFSVGCVFSAACGKKNKEEEETHSHSYTSTVTKEATCTEEGETTYTCDCGDTYTEAIPALGHNWSAWTEVEAADCENEGSQSRKCNRCGVEETGTIAALGHNYSVTEWKWEGDDDNGYQVTATYVCANDSSHTGTTEPVTAQLENGVYTATVTIGTQTFTDTKTVASQGGEQETEGVHYFVDELGATAGDKVGGSDGTDVTANAYFTISSSAVTLEYATVSSASATVYDGSTRSFTMGLKQNDSVKVNEGATTKAITVTANDDIDLYLYIGIANDGFSSNRTGTINYSVDGVEGTPISQSARANVPTINVQMQAGQVLSVTATMTLDSGQADNVNGKLWLFGAEAFGYDFGGEGGTTEPGTEDTYTITITSTETTVNVGESISLGADVYKNGVKDDSATVVWSASTDDGTVEIDGSTIKGVSAGSVTLTATYYDTDGTTPLATATMAITVIEGINPETAIIGTWTGYAEFTLGAYGLEGVFGADITLEVKSSYFEMTVKNIVGIDANGKSLESLISTFITGSVELFGQGSTWQYVETTEEGYKYTAYDSEIDSFDIWLKTLDGVQYVNLTLTTSYNVYDFLSIDIIITDQAVDNSSNSHPIRGVSFSEESVTFDEGLSAEVTYRVKTTNGVTYTDGAYTIDYTGYESIIEVTDDKQGTITVKGKSAGTAYITLSAGGYTETLTVVVTPATVCGVEFENVDGGIVTTVETSNTLSDAPAFTATYTNGSTVAQGVYPGDDATWTSSNQDVATVANGGTVTLLSAGVTTITVEINGYSASYVLVVGYADMAEGEELIGEWKGDMEFTFETGIGNNKTTHNATGTATAEVVVGAVSLTFDVLVDGTVYSGNTFDVWTNAALYKAGDAYYVIDADGGDITAITLTEGNLSTTITYKMTIKYNGNTYANSTSVTETFNLSLYKPAESRVEAAATGTTLTDTATSATATFGNDSTLTVTTTKNGNGEVEYELAGTASTMTAEQAYVFWNGVAAAHDAYVVITIKLEEGETLYWLSSDGNTKSIAWNDSSEVVDGYVSMVIRLSGALPEDGTVSITERTYYIVSADNTYVTHTVDVSNVEIPSDPHSYADPDAEGYDGDANIYWDWDSIEDRSQTSGSVDVYILCTECNEWVKYTTNYAVDQNDGTSFTASVEAGGYSYTGTQKMEISVSSAEDLAAALEKGGLISITANDTATIEGTYEIDGDVTLTIGENVTLSNGGQKAESTITVVEGGCLVIDGDGTVDNVSDNCAAVFVEEGGEAVLNGGTYTRSGENTTGGTYYTIVNHGTLTIGEGVTVETDAVTGSSMVENGGAETNATMTITGGTFKSSSNSMIKNDVNGKLIITGGTFTGNGNTAVILNCAELEISGGTFEQAKTGEDVSNVVVWNYENSDASLYPTAKISGGNFSGGTSATIYNDGNGEMTISGGTFDNAEWATVVSEGELTIDGGAFTSSGSGVGIYLVWAYGGDITISGGTFTAGDATDYDIVASNSGSVAIYGGVFGGVTGTKILYASGEGSSVTVYGGTFTNDPSDYLGEGYIAVPTIVMDDNDEQETVYEVKKGTTIEYDFTDTGWTETLADQFAYTSDGGYLTKYRPSDEISYDDNGILKSVDVPREKTSSGTVTGSEYKSSIDGGFKTGEKTQKKDSLSTEDDNTQVFTGYMMLDLSSFAEATSVTISIEFKTGSTGGTGEDRTVALVSELVAWNNYTTGSGLAEATSGKNDTENTTLTYTVDFDKLGEDDILYIIWSENIKIYNITITVVE